MCSAERVVGEKGGPGPHPSGESWPAAFDDNRPSTVLRRPVEAWPDAGRPPPSRNRPTAGRRHPQDAPLARRPPGAERCELRGGGPDVLEEDDRSAGEWRRVGNGVEPEAVEERADGVDDRAGGVGVPLADEPRDCEERPLLREVQAVAAGVEKPPEFGEPLVGEVRGVERTAFGALRGGREPGEPLPLVRKEWPAGEERAGREPPVGNFERRPGRVFETGCGATRSAERSFVNRDPSSRPSARPVPGSRGRRGSRSSNAFARRPTYPGSHRGPEGVETCLTVRLHVILHRVRRRGRPKMTTAWRAISHETETPARAEVRRRPMPAGGGQCPRSSPRELVEKFAALPAGHRGRVVGGDALHLGPVGRLPVPGLQRTIPRRSARGGHACPSCRVTWLALPRPRPSWIKTARATRRRCHLSDTTSTVSITPRPRWRNSRAPGGR